MKKDHVEMIAVADLHTVTGGVYRMGRGLERAVVDGLKNIVHSRNEAASGSLITSLRRYMTGAAQSKPRNWLHGASISSLTKDLD